MTLKEIAYDKIKSRIIKGTYPAGKMLNEIEIGKELDISRTPVREALNMLAQEKFVEIIPKKGVLVRGLTVAEVNQCFEARLLLEPYIVRNYPQRIDPAALDWVYENSGKLNRDEETALTCFDLDDVFHRAIGSAIPNMFFSDMLMHLYDQTQRIRMMINVKTRGKTSLAEHMHIIELIRAGDYEAAEAALREHLQKSRDAAVNTLISHDLNVL